MMCKSAIIERAAEHRQGQTIGFDVQIPVPNRDSMLLTNKDVKVYDTVVQSTADGT